MDQAVSVQAVTAQAITAQAVTAQAVTAQAITAQAVTAQAITAQAVTAQAVTVPPTCNLQACAQSTGPQLRVPYLQVLVTQKITQEQHLATPSAVVRLPRPCNSQYPRPLIQAPGPPPNAPHLPDASHAKDHLEPPSTAFLFAQTLLDPP